MMRTFAAVLVLSVSVVSVGCSKSDTAPAPAPVPSLPAVAPLAPLADTMQTALAKEIDEVRLSGKWDALRKRWTGQHVSWEVTRYDALCKTAGHCNVAAFPVRRAAQQGWMPEVSFADGEFAKIAQACGTAECKVKVDGTLVEVRGSDAQPAGVRIANVKVVSATRG